MKAFAVLAAAATAAAATLSARDVTPITIKGNAFMQGSSRFYIRGVDWQPGGAANPVDPLADNYSNCQRDIQRFQDLGLNTVRVYTADNSLGHDNCMNALAAANIYLILDVNWSKYSLNRADNHSCWVSYNSAYLQNVFATIDAFAKYPNTLAFFSGNEIINDLNTTVAAPFIKAVTRDMKQYISARKYRQIPVGYSGADVEKNRIQTANYLNCGSDAGSRSDFFAFNDYSYCKSDFQTAWASKVRDFSNYSLPMFLSEYGCNTNLPRDFKEVQDLYNTQEMTPVFSGGLVYEYFQEDSNYGLVNADGSSTLPDYDTLKAMNAAVALPSDGGGYRSDSGSASTCPPQDANWPNLGQTLPVIPPAAQKLMSSGAGQGVGLSGPGSQNGAGASVVGAQSQSYSSSSSSAGGGSGGGSSTSSGGSSSSSPGVAGAVTIPPMSVAPFVVSIVVLISSLAGSSLFVL